jgi:hypothetical protein
MPCGRGRCTADRGGHWQAPETSGRGCYTHGQAECMWLRRATEGHEYRGTGEGRPLRARGKGGHASTHPRQTHPEKGCLDAGDVDGMRERTEERREMKGK